MTLCYLGLLMNSLVWITCSSPAHMVIWKKLKSVNSVAVGEQTSHTVTCCVLLNTEKSCIRAQCELKSIVNVHKFTILALWLDNIKTQFLIF